MKTSVFANRLKALRLAANKTQTSLANHLGYVPSAVQNYESGRCEPRLADVIRISQFLHVSVDFLIGADSSPQDCHILFIPQEDTLQLHLANQLMQYCKSATEAEKETLSDFLDFFAYKKTHPKP